jgi:hypothetical protein
MEFTLPLIAKKSELLVVSTANCDALLNPFSSTTQDELRTMLGEAASITREDEQMIEECGKEEEHLRKMQYLKKQKKAPMVTDRLMNHLIKMLGVESLVEQHCDDGHQRRAKIFGAGVGRV